MILLVTVLRLQQFLAQAMIREGLKNVTAGANPMGIRKGMEKAIQQLLKN